MKLNFGGEEYQIPNSDDWTVGELADAERAIGRSFGSGSNGDDMSISFFIAIRRKDKEIDAVQLADACRQVKMSDFDTSDDEDDVSPLDETKQLPDVPSTSGIPLSDRSASRSLSRN